MDRDKYGQSPCSGQRSHPSPSSTSALLYNLFIENPFVPKSFKDRQAAKSAPSSSRLRHPPQQHAPRRHHEEDRQGSRRPPRSQHDSHRAPAKVHLRALDPRYRDVSFRARSTLSVSDLESRIRLKYARAAEPLAKTAVFQLYDAEGCQLAPSDSITGEVTRLWYRVSRSISAMETWKFSEYADRADAPLDNVLAAELLAAIEAGSTVGGLKTVFAKHMGIRDEKRVVVVARDGIRSGTLNGDHWTVRQIGKSWLCRWLSFDEAPEGRYVLLRGLRRQYVWYPHAKDVGRPVDVAFLGHYLATRVLQRVHSCDKTELTGPIDIRLSLDGTPCDSEAVARWGATYDFEVADDDVAEAFSLEEAWLLGTTEQCTTCVEDKKLSEMPIRISSRCQHQPTVCKDCLAHWLQSSVESGAWDKLKCPDCREPIDWKDVKRHASPETFARYDKLVLRSAFQQLPNFRFCLSPTCESGQIEDEQCAKFECAACAATHCIHHNVPWHTGQTCEEYDGDKRNRHRKAAEKASAKLVKKTSKPCPSCKVDVHRYTGCAHMTCVCGHEWCYLCLAPYTHDEHGFLSCQHVPGRCSEPDLINGLPLPADGIRFGGVNDPLHPHPQRAAPRRVRRQRQQPPPPPPAPAAVPGEPGDPFPPLPLPPTATTPDRSDDAADGEFESASASAGFRPQHLRRAIRVAISVPGQTGRRTGRR